MHGFEANYNADFVVPFGKIMRLGSESFDGELTEFRLWKKRKKLKMKLKEKRSSQTDNKDGFVGITFDPTAIRSSSP
jgi:hypothetical protein